ncbi:MAG: SdiA-regulated domain-containing protein [Bacteroidales bacterium]|nr:SdiA-regulated domain-containing protein [Bacteroidales bacterium]
MKRLFLFALCAAMALTACQPKTPEDPDGPENPSRPQPEQKDTPGPGVYNFVLPDNCGKTAWAAGDKIYLTGGYTPNSIIVTVSGSDISADGKTAAVNLVAVPDNTFGPDSFYAAYPAELIDEEDTFCEDIFNFTDTDAPLMGAWLAEGNTFKFESLCGSVKFTVDGSWDGCVFCSTKWDYVRFETFSAQINSEAPNYKRSRKEGHYFFNKTLADGGATFFFPGTLTLDEGFHIYLRKGNSYPKVFTRTEALNLKRTDVLDLGNITASLADYDGPAPEDPVMPVMGKYTKYDIKEVPEMSGICLNNDKSFLWAVGDEGSLAQISLDGKATKLWAKGADMEDITIHPETGDLYVALEGDQKVIKIAAPDYTKNWTNVFKVQEAIDGKYGNSGLEGITYYKDDVLFVGSQVGANLWKYSLDGERLWMVSLRELTGKAISEVAGLCYDHKNDWLWVVDSETQKIYVLDEEITHILATYPIRYAGNCESICVDPDHDCVWIGDDDDSVPHLFKIAFEGL